MTWSPYKALEDRFDELHDEGVPLSAIPRVRPGDAGREVEIDSVRCLAREPGMSPRGPRGSLRPGGSLPCQVTSDDALPKRPAVSGPAEPGGASRRLGGGQSASRASTGGRCDAENERAKLQSARRGPRSEG